MCEHRVVMGRLDQRRLEVKRTAQSNEIVSTIKASPGTLKAERLQPQWKLHRALTDCSALVRRRVSGFHVGGDDRAYEAAKGAQTEIRDGVFVCEVEAACPALGDEVFDDLPNDDGDGSESCTEKNSVPAGESERSKRDNQCCGQECPIEEMEDVVEVLDRIEQVGHIASQIGDEGKDEESGDEVGVVANALAAPPPNRNDQRCDWV